MKKRYLLILLAFIIGFLMVIFFINSNETIDNTSTKQVAETTISQNTAPYNKNFSWDDLGIKPLKNLEGNHYVFTAFDFDEKNNELVIAGNYEKNKILFIKDTLVKELEINDIPIDILSTNEAIYVLCLTKFMVIQNRNVVTEFHHTINNVTSFDKLLFFNNNLNVLMADGSTYKYTDHSFEFSPSLLTKNNTEIWVQKTSPKSFEIKSKPSDEKLNKKAFYTNEIGSITFVGTDTTNYYVIIDRIKNTTPFSAARELKGSHDNFQKTIIELPVRKFSFIKNDIKIHKKNMYTVTVTENHVTLKSIAL